MLISTLLMASFNSGDVAPELALDSVEEAAETSVHPKRGPHRHPKPRDPKPRKRKKRFHRFHHGGQFGVSSTISMGALYGDDSPWFSINFQSEARTSPRSSTAVHLGLSGVGEETYADFGAQGRYYFAGNFEAGAFGGMGFTASLEPDQEILLVRFGPTAGYKQILPGGLTMEVRFLTDFMPLTEDFILLYGGHVGLGGSM
jgi:hypothetical protein